MSEAKKALRRRIAPSVSLKLDLADDSGTTFTREFRLSFDFNAAALVKERTGFEVITGEAFKEFGAQTLSVLFWAAILASHPEYDSEEGLIVIRSYMDASNVEQISLAVRDAYLASLPKERREAILENKPEDPTNPAAE